jgi:uncharacterized protein YjcR
MLNSSEHITAKDLENLYGRAMKPTELAKFLGIDVRTVKKYGDRWGGVEVAPGYMRFFENRVLEALNAEFDKETRKEALSRKCNLPRNHQTDHLSGCNEKILSGGGHLGRRNTKRTGSSVIEDRFGIFGENRGLGK